MIAGCGVDAHREAIRRSVANFDQMADLLSEVKDEPTMKAVEEKIAQRHADFQRDADRARALPPVDPSRNETYEKEFGAKMRAAFKRYAEQRERIGKLPGGPEFIGRIDKLAVGHGP
jgi:hypothetical protein